MYEDGQPGEIFYHHVEGRLDDLRFDGSFATAISMSLQYGVPLQVLVDKFSHMRFEPSGFTKNPDIPMAKSIMDYIFRWLASNFSTVMRSRRRDRQTGPGRGSSPEKKWCPSPLMRRAAGAGSDDQQRDELVSTRRAAMPRLRCHHDPAVALAINA